MGSPETMEACAADTAPAPAAPAADRRAPPGDTLALTFDDGPDPRGTPAVLQALDRSGARATFFVIGPCAERHAELVRRVQAGGHRIALHCERHVRHTELDPSAIRRDTASALERLDRLGIRPALWRVPWGVRSPGTEAVAAEFALTLVGWDVDTHDWRGDSATDMFKHTRAQLASGVVVLAHDGIGPGARRADCRQTAAYVDLVAQHAAESGLHLSSL
jgi:peptidoglycan/xylan/chitin deacetylase (PgdA/CDA1 family)